MWLSEWKRERTEDSEERTSVGTVTLAGTQPAAYVDGERRALTVFGPGGYRWCPAERQQVLVLKAGADGEVPCVAGVKTESGGIAPGEVAISAMGGGAQVRLGMDNKVHLTGELWINGKSLEEIVMGYLTGGGTGGT